LYDGEHFPTTIFKERFRGNLGVYLGVETLTFAFHIFFTACSERLLHDILLTVIRVGFSSTFSFFFFLDLDSGYFKGVR